MKKPNSWGFIIHHFYTSECIICGNTTKKNTAYGCCRRCAHLDDAEQMHDTELLSIAKQKNILCDKKSSFAHIAVLEKIHQCIQCGTIEQKHYASGECYKCFQKKYRLSKKNKEFQPIRPRRHIEHPNYNFKFVIPKKNIFPVYLASNGKTYIRPSNIRLFFKFREELEKKIKKGEIF